MVTSNHVVIRLAELIAELRSKRDKIEKEFREKLAEIDNKITAVVMTRELLLETNGRAQTSVQLGLETAMSADLATAKSHKEALKRIAEVNNDRVNVTQAADLLISIGRAKGKRRNLVASIYTLLKESGEWQWDSPGVFRLINSHGSVEDRA